MRWVLETLTPTIRWASVFRAVNKRLALAAHTRPAL